SASARHAAFYLAFAERAATALAGPDQAAWVGRLDRDYHNLRAALGWSLEHGQAGTAARIGVALTRFWSAGSHIRESREWLDRILAAPGGLPDLLHVDVLYSAGMLARYQGHHGPANALAEQSLALARAVPDRSAIARALTLLGMTA